MFFIISILSTNICSIPVQYNNRKYNFLENDKLIEQYNITIYKINGFNIEKVVKNIDNEKAIELKNRFNEINDNFNDTIINTEKKIDLLIELEIIPSDDLLYNNYYKYKNELLNKSIIKKNADGVNFGLFGIVVGSFFGRTSNFINFKFSGFPLIIRCNEGGTISFIGFPNSWEKTVNNPLTFFSLAFFGYIALRPILDMDGGLIFGGGFFVFSI
jgi:hypothetical protein